MAEVTPANPIQSNAVTFSISHFEVKFSLLIFVRKDAWSPCLILNLLCILG